MSGPEIEVTSLGHFFSERRSPTFLREIKAEKKRNGKKKYDLCVTRTDECMKMKNRRNLHFGDNGVKLFR